MSNLTIYTIYENPSDFPGKFVLRCRIIDGGRTYVSMLPDAVTDTLDEARECLPPGLTCIERSPQDDPVIVESWI